MAAAANVRFCIVQSVEWITEEPRYQGIEEEAREWLW